MELIMDYRSLGPRAQDWALRLAGLGALVAVPILADGLRHVELAEHGHPGPLAVVVALVMVAALWSGLGLALGGGGLFRLLPLPPRAWLPVSRKARLRQEGGQ
jgi:hypothetical protein